MSARRVEVLYETMHGDVRAKSERVAVWYRPTQPRAVLARRARHAIEMRARRFRQSELLPDVRVCPIPHKRVERLAIVRPDQEQRAGIPLPTSKHKTEADKGRGRGAYDPGNPGSKLYRVGGLRP